MGVTDSHSEGWLPLVLEEMVLKLNHVLGEQLSLHRKVNLIMAAVKIEQSVLDADGAALSQVASDLATLLASGNLSDADQTTLQNGIDAITALDTLQVTPPAPVDPTPVDPPVDPNA